MASNPIAMASVTVEELRGLLQSAGRSFLPDYVAERLKDRPLSMCLDEIGEFDELISPLVEIARKRMEAEGIEAPARFTSPLPKLSSRERKWAFTLSVLLPYYAFCSFFNRRNPEEAEAALIEGIGWGRTLRDLRRESLLWGGLAILYSHVRRHEEQLDAYRSALRLAEEAGDLKLEMLQAGDLSAALVTLDKLAAADELIDEKVEKGRRVLSPQDQEIFLPILLMNKGRILSSQNRKAEAIVVLQEALDLAEQGNQRDSMMPILINLGLLYRYLGDERRNIACQQEVVRLAEEMRHAIAAIWGYIHIAESHIEGQDFESAEKALGFAQSHMEESSAHHADYLHMRWARVYLEQGKFEEGIEHCRAVLNGDHRKVPPSTLAAILHLLGRLQAGLERFDEAEEAFRRGLEVKQGMEARESRTRMRTDLARLLIRRGRNDEATEILCSIISEPETDQEESATLAQAYELLAGIAEGRGDLRSALDYTRKGRDLGNRALEAKGERSLQNARILSEIELVRREAENERRERRKTETTLAEVIISLEGKRHVIDNVERQLNKTLSFLEKEKASEVLDALKNALVQIDGKEHRGKEALTYLHTINPEFFVRLRKRCSTLTRKQERLCGLIRAGLTSSEIASILNISYEGMRAQRKRLRKQLELSPNDNLEKVIEDL